MTTPEALKALYVALGGDADDVATANTSVDVLNAIAVKFEGSGDATLNTDAIMNVVAVLDNMIPDPTLIDKNITANGTYNASSDEADGYKKVVVDVSPSLAEKNVTANGTYNASSDNVQGYSKVVVNVAEQNNSNLVRNGSETAFVLRTSIEKITVPEGYTSLNSYDTFQNIAVLKEVYLPSTFASNALVSTAFNGSNALEKITINKAEGSISGAPWGAPASCQIIWAG